MPDKLDEYRGKRKFTSSLEPSGLGGQPIRPSEHLRFVIQKHDATRLHYDLRLELAGVFKSWAVTRGPSLDPGQKRLAVQVEDHPLEYGDFEGTIPENDYGGGSVMIWDRGYWAPETTASPDQSLRDGELKFILAGAKLKGSWVLIRLKPKPGETRNNWLLIKHRDQWATPGRDDVLDADRSQASGRSMTAIARRIGKPAKSFMTEGGATSATAVWDASVSTRTYRRSAAMRTTAATSIKAAKPKLSHPERILWPETGVTKQQLADYLLAVAPKMIVHLCGRPCSLLRAPEGVAHATFFQRHPLPGQRGEVDEIRVDRKHQPYLQIDNAQTLVAMAQMSVVEFHPWNCAPFLPHTPGRLVFDLDPAPDVAFTAVITAARELRERITAIGLVPFCKTTGGKGLHVVVPLTPDESMGWPQAKLLAQTVSAQMAEDSPTRYLIKMTKSRRAGRIYLDYLRNDVTATAVAPLSPRARPGSTVSMPLTWRQVRIGLDPGRYTLSTVPAILAISKAWNDYAHSDRPLKQAVMKLLGGGK